MLQVKNIIKIIIYTQRKKFRVQKKKFRIHRKKFCTHKKNIRGNGDSDRLLHLLGNIQTVKLNYRHTDKSCSKVPLNN